MKLKLKALLVAFVLMIGLCMTLNVEAALTINTKNVTVTKGFTTKLKASGAKKIKWSTSNKKIATVNKSGKVTAKNPGTAVITAKAGTEQVSCTVKVRANEYNATKITQATGVPFIVTMMKYNGKGMIIEGMFVNTTYSSRYLGTISMKVKDGSNGKLLAVPKVRINDTIPARKYVGYEFKIMKQHVKAKKYDLGKMTNVSTVY